MCEIPKSFDWIKAVVPHSFWTAIDYRGEARYVAVYWDRHSDLAFCTDGRKLLMGVSWKAYKRLIGQFDALIQVSLGTRSNEASVWFVVDRLGGSNAQWIAPWHIASKFLKEQWGGMHEDLAIPANKTIQEFLHFIRMESSGEPDGTVHRMGEPELPRSLQDDFACDDAFKADYRKAISDM